MAIINSYTAIPKTLPIVNPLVFLLTLIFLFGSIVVTQARTSLVSLPARQNVDIRLADTGIALIQEKRVLTLKKGLNKIDFSWQNVMIDPSSITLLLLSNPNDITILNVSYPPNEAALVWELFSNKDLEEKVMITYLLANIDGLTAYTAFSNLNESKLNLKTFLVIRNFSGENFNKATIHANTGDSVKISSDTLETKRVLLSEKKDIPVTKVYTWNSLTMPHEPEKTRMAIGIPTTYEMNNDKLSNLGESALFEGKARLFQDDGKNGSIFLGEDIAVYTPINDKVNLKIGDSRDIVVTQLRLETKRSNIKRNTKGHIQVFDEIIKDKIIIENLKDTPVTLSLVETIQGQWEPVKISMDYQKKDHKTLIFKVSLLAREKKTVQLHYKVLNIFAQKFAQYNRVFN